MDISSHSIMPCVMIVDDHGLSRHHTIQALRHIDCRVKQANSGAEGLRGALLFRPDLIFLDFHLPDMSGISLLREIWRAWPDPDPKPKTVMLSGGMPALPRDKMNALQIIALLTKPVEAEAISHLAGRHLQQKYGIRESLTTSPGVVPSNELRKVFLEDLEQQLRSLDLHLDNLEWKPARAVLHQLIAAASICREEALERNGRLLNDCLAEPVQPVRIAQAYHGLRMAVSRARKMVRRRG